MKRRITGDGTELAKFPLNLLRERLREAMALRSTHAKEVSLKAGLGDTYVADILSGKNKNPRIPVLKSISEVLQCDLRYLLGHADTFTTEQGQRELYPIPVLYISEMGVFRPMLAAPKNSPLRTINADLNHDYPHASHFAVDVRDDTMARSKLRQGMTALCIDLHSARLIVESDRMYAISRTFDGKNAEVTCKRAKVYQDRTEFHIEPNGNGNSMLTVLSGSQVDNEGAKVEVLGRIFGAQIIF